MSYGFRCKGEQGNVTVDGNTRQYVYRGKYTEWIEERLDPNDSLILSGSLIHTHTHYIDVMYPVGITGGSERPMVFSELLYSDVDDLHSAGFAIVGMKYNGTIITSMPNTRPHVAMWRIYGVMAQNQAVTPPAIRVFTPVIGLDSVYDYPEVAATTTLPYYDAPAYVDPHAFNIYNESSELVFTSLARMLFINPPRAITLKTAYRDWAEKSVTMEPPRSNSTTHDYGSDLSGISIDLTTLAPFFTFRGSNQYRRLQIYSQVFSCNGNTLTGKWVRSYSGSPPFINSYNQAAVGDTGDGSSYQKFRLFSSINNADFP